MAPVPSLRGPARSCLIAAGILLLAASLVLQDMFRSNRPHEMQNMPLVAGITLFNLVRCVHLIRCVSWFAKSFGQRTKSKLKYYGWVLGVIVVVSLNALLFVAAVATLPAVIAG